MAPSASASASPVVANTASSLTAAASARKETDTSIAPSLATRTRTTTNSATASSDESNKDDKSGGLSTGAIVAIVVCSIVAGAGLLAWTLFRKLKLKNNRFNEREQPLDFSPNSGGDDLFEKSLQRSASVASADRQRRELVAELDNDSLTAGIPEHDFTAGPQPYGYGADYGNGADYGTGYDFSSPRNEGFDPNYSYAVHDQAAMYPEHGYAGDYPAGEYPTQDYHGAHGGADGYDQHGYPQQQQYSANDGYSPTERGGPAPAPTAAAGPTAPLSSRGHTPAQQFDAFSGSDFEITARPTGGAMGDAGPYAQAASYRY